MVQWIQIDVGEELGGLIADWQSTPPLERCEKRIGRKDAVLNQFLPKLLLAADERG
jgi:hypothetical protein